KRQSIPSICPTSGRAKYSQNNCTSNEVPRNTSIMATEKLLSSQLGEMRPRPNAKAKKPPSRVEYTVNCAVTHAPSSKGGTYDNQFITSLAGAQLFGAAAGGLARVGVAKAVIA